MVDLNGDGLIDYLYAQPIHRRMVLTIHVLPFGITKNGSLVWDDTVSVPWVEYEVSGSESAPLSLTSSVRPLEVNGDGLVDFCTQTIIE